MQDRTDRYVAPQLTLVGDATELIRGLGGLGLDLRSETVPSHFEFEDDQQSTDS